MPARSAQLADNLVGSANLFQHADRLPSRSVNFITAHDGFTLNDLVSTTTSTTWPTARATATAPTTTSAGTAASRDPTDDPAIEALRRQQIKNFLTILLMSEGRPMLLMGDEVRRTQHGNNNAYCQDNADLPGSTGTTSPATPTSTDSPAA